MLNLHTRPDLARDKGDTLDCKLHWYPKFCNHYIGSNFYTDRVILFIIMENVKKLDD